MADLAQPPLCRRLLPFFLALLSQPACQAEDQHILAVGGPGWALQFDGEQEFVVLTRALPPLPLTLELWVRPQGLVDGLGERVVTYNDKGVVLSRYSANAGLNLFTILYNGAEIWHGAGQIRVEEVRNAKDTLFHYAFVVDNESQYAVYVNGSLSASGALSTADVAKMSDPSTIAFPWILGTRMEYVAGQYHLDGRCFGGELDELRWWNVALGPEELQKWMTVAPPPDQPGLLHRWSFDEPSSEAVDGLLAGGGDASRAPSRVPSAVGLVGGPVAVVAASSARAQTLRICAAVTPAVSNASAWANFDVAVGQTGRLGLPGALAGEAFEVELSWAGMSKWCGEIHFHPSAAGEEQLPFTVEVQLPDSAGGGNLSASSFVSTRIADNLPPVAGLARALLTNGRDSYGSLGVWDLPSGDTDSHFSFSMWVKPSAVVEDSYFISKHLSKGTNLMFFGFYSGRYLLRIDCARGCNGGAKAVGRALLPSAADDTVLASGKTAEQVTAERGLPHLVTVTLRCHTRGNEDPANDPARATVTFYVDGYSIGTMDDFAACFHRPLLPEDYAEDEDPLEHPAPWEMGQEYDGGELDEHLPGLAVTPSNFFAGIFDDLRFWGRDLNNAEVQALADGVDVAEADLIVRYTFDVGKAVCSAQQLVFTNLSCYDLNEAQGRTGASERFSFTNSRIGKGAHFVSSPFNKVRGSKLHQSMEVGTCGTVTLVGSDPDGDELTYSLPTGFSLPGLELQSGGVLQYCSSSTGDVEVPFDACDPLGQCASGTSGLGTAVFHVLLKGPSITHLQVLPEYGVLRLRFSEPTNTPPAGSVALVRALLQVSGLPAGTRVFAGDWEKGGQALRLLLAQEGSSMPGWVVALRGDGASSNDGDSALAALRDISVRVHQAGMLRDAAATSFPSAGVAPPAQRLVCREGQRLAPGEAECQSCPEGYEVRLDAGDSGHCQICRAGWYKLGAGPEFCELCPPGRFASAPGSISCNACEDVLPGSTTVSVPSTSESDCACPKGTVFVRDSPGARARCEACGEGLLCEGGLGENGTGHRPPQQAAGFFGGVPSWEGGPPSLLLRCSSKERCPAGMELGTCPPDVTGRACSECREGTYLDDQSCKPCSDHVGNFFAASVVVIVVLGALVLIISYSLHSMTPYCDAIMTASASASLAVATLQAFSALGSININWPEPLHSVKEFLRIFVIQFDLMRPGCVFGTNDALFSYLGSLVAYPCFAFLLALSMGALHMRGNRAVSMDSAVNAQGMVMVVAYLSITIISVLPLQCEGNPDGSKSVVAYRGVECWNSREHIVMVVFALMSSAIFVLGFMAAVIWAIWSYPVKIVRPNGIGFLMRFQFLFARFSSERYYYALIFSVRNLLIGLIPLLAEVPEVQLILMASVFLNSLAVQCALWPWRARDANFLDAAFAIALTLMVVSSAMLGDFDVAKSRTTAQVFVIGGMIAIAAGTLVTLAYCVYRLKGRSRKYSIFLSHHKVGSGLLARWFKMLLEEEGVNRVFLDSDDVMKLDSLVDTVARDCDNVVVLLTQQTLARPWCAMEIACAYKAGTTIVPVLCDGFGGVPDEFLEQLAHIWSDDEVNLMANCGVTVDDVRQAYRAFRELPMRQLQRAGANVERHRQAVQDVLKFCKQVGKLRKLRVRMSRGTKFTKSSTLRFSDRDTRQGEWVLIIGNMVEPEAACACRVLQRMVQVRMQLQVGLFGEEDFSLCQQGCVLVVLSPGLLENPDFAAELVQAHENEGVQLVPLLGSESFHFPDSDFWDRLSAGKVVSTEELRLRNLDTERTKLAYRRLFNALALKFTGHGSMTIQDAEMRAVCRRIRALLS